MEYLRPKCARGVPDLPHINCPTQYGGPGLVFRDIFSVLEEIFLSIRDLTPECLIA